MESFRVWTKDAHVLLDIDYNEKYVKNVVQHLKHFSFGKMLPRTVANFSDCTVLAKANIGKKSREVLEKMQVNGLEG